MVWGETAVMTPDEILNLVWVTSSIPPPWFVALLDHLRDGCFSIWSLLKTLQHLQQDKTYLVLPQDGNCSAIHHTQTFWGPPMYCTPSTEKGMQSPAWFSCKAVFQSSCLFTLWTKYASWQSVQWIISCTQCPMPSLFSSPACSHPRSQAGKPMMAHQVVPGPQDPCPTSWEFSLLDWDTIH